MSEHLTRTLGQIDALVEAAARALFATHGLPLGERRVDFGDTPEDHDLASSVGFTGPEIRGALLMTTRQDLVELAWPFELRHQPPSERDVCDWAGELVNQLVGRVKNALVPFGLALEQSTPTVVTISQLSMANTGKATVSWSYSLNGTARAQGATVAVPTNLQPANNPTCGTYPCYLILAEVSYTYTPLFGYFTTGTIALADNLYSTPRSAACVLYPPESVTTC